MPTHKVLNDAIAHIRSLAQLRGRNAAWAEQAVCGAVTLTASEAAKEHLIEFVANDVADLLAKADGRTVQVGERSVTLQFKGATVRDCVPGARTRFVGITTNPTIAYLLLLGGILGLGLEAMHPGAMLPGIVGAICLLVGLYASQLLPVNYAGLALMALNVAMLVAEAVTPTVGALGVGGVVSFVIGSVMLMNTGVLGYAVNLGVIAGIAVGFAALLASSCAGLPRAPRSTVHRRWGDAVRGRPVVATGRGRRGELDDAAWGALARVLRHGTSCWRAGAHGIAGRIVVAGRADASRSASLMKDRR